MILRLSVSNWANIEHLEISFQRGANLIFGSNGSGKTSLLNAIFFALTGSLPYPAPPGIMVKSGATEATIELDFEDPKGNRYRIRRIIRSGRKKSDAHLYPLINDVEQEEIASGHDEVTNKALKLLGVGPKYFVRAIFMGEGDIYRFLTKPERGLETELNAILGIQKVIQIRDEVSKVKKDLNRRIKELERKVKELETKIGDHEDIESLEKQLNEINEKIKALDQKIARLEEKRDDLLKKLKSFDELANLDQQIEKYKKRLETLTQGLPGEGGYKERLENYLKAKKEELSSVQKDLEKLRAEISALGSRLEDLKIEIEKLKGVTAICPTCERPLTREDAERIIKRKTDRMNSILAEMDTKKKQFTEQERKLKDLEKEVKNLEIKLRELNNILEELKEINKRKAKLQTVVIGKKEDIETELNKIKEEILQLRTERDKLLIEKGKTEEKIKASKVKLEDLKFDLRDLVHKSHVTDLFINACKYVTEKLLNNVIAAARNEATNIWSKIRKGIWEVNWDSKLMPVVKNPQSEYIPEQLCGAEKIILFIALRIALAKHVTNPGFLIFDEPLEHLDEERKKLMKDLLLTIPEEGINQIIVASCDNEILNEKWDKVITL